MNSLDKQTFPLQLCLAGWAKCLREYKDCAVLEPAAAVSWVCSCSRSSEEAQLQSTA